MSGVRPDGSDEAYDVTESDQDVSGSMGVSSEREGETGPGQHAPTGTRDTSVAPTPDDAPPEQSVGGHEPSPGGLPPKADPPSTGS